MMISPEARPDAVKRSSQYPEASISGGLGLWALALGIVVALHLGAAAWLLSPARNAQDGIPNDDAIAVDLVPTPFEQATFPDDTAGPPVEQSAAPTSDDTKADSPPPAPETPPPAEAQRKPDTPPPTPIASSLPSSSDAVLQPSTDTPPNKTEKEKPDPAAMEKTPDTRIDDTLRLTTPSQASQGRAALLGGAHRPSAAAQATWRGAVGLHLGRNRRYPQDARDHGLQGIAIIRVSVDADGHVTSCTLVKSSGHMLLDGEALALLRRADPLPKPPVGLPVPITLTVPVSFAIH